MTKHAKNTPIIFPITFIDKLVTRNELGQPFTLMDYQHDILRPAFAFDIGRPAAVGHNPVFVRQEVRQNHAQRRFDAMVGSDAGSTERDPCLANDLEQSLARVFKTMEGIIQHNPELQREAEVQSKSIFMANGTTITAISGDYAGALRSEGAVNSTTGTGRSSGTHM